ncbi:hypothetical protein NW915_09420 [Enterobacter hormaechei subsp. hoffmannii]|uniref:hypothetical protein n=1 Tax=Enterobacter hormaechei TaxID=158836 RepID=UPI0022313D60|nr:hypothetical protein [Enterobacter hormaechei]MCW3887794.1 hypothetical protein [Enterobacter hormaechei subsp. hoffmannii]
MKQKFIEWFTKNNNGCSPAMEDDRSFVYEMTQNMFEAYQAGVAEGEAKCAALAAESAGMKKFCEDAAFDADYESELLGERGGFVDGLSLVKIPATDAFLAEVRAQGVEMFMESDECSQEAYGLALHFAAQLRQDANAAELVAAGIITKVGE